MSHQGGKLHGQPEDKSSKSLGIIKIPLNLITAASNPCKGTDQDDNMPEYFNKSTISLKYEK